MYCKYCGKEISDNATFCRYCGKEMQTTSRRTADRNTVDYGTESMRTEYKTIDSENRYSSRNGGDKYACQEETKKQSPKVSQIVWQIVWSVFLLCGMLYATNPDNNILGIHGMRKAYATAQEVVEAELLSPRSAVFPRFEPEFVTQGTKKVTYEGVEYEVYTVSAYVDAHNAFGTLVRYRFVVEVGFPTGVDHDGYYYNIVSLTT